MHGMLNGYNNKMENYYFFWGKESYLSQFFKRNIIIDGITFSCCEQYMMYKKALLFGDYEIAMQILSKSSPKDMKALGRKVRGFNEEVWKQHREQIVYEGNFAKFTQHQDLKALLLSNKDCIFVEASPYDTVWGIGLRASDPKAKHKSTWRGSNLLGYIITYIRDELASMQ